VLVLGALAATPWPAQRLDWQPALAAGEPWRWWSAAFVHWSAWHLATNLLAAAVVTAWGIVARAPLAAALAWFAAWPLTHLVLLTQPDLQHYGGLSGVLHAGVAVVSMWLLWRGRGAARWIGGAVLAGLALKIVMEAPWQGTLQPDALTGVPMAPLAHLGGAVAGVLLGALAAWLGDPGGHTAAGDADRPPTGRGPGAPVARVAPAAGSPAGAAADAASAAAAAGASSAGAAAGASRRPLDGVAVACLLLCCAIWGVNQVAAKVALDEVPPLLQAGVRSVGAALLLSLWVRVRGLSLRTPAGGAPTWRAGWLAGALFGAEFACIFVGLQYTTASRMVVFLYLSPFVVALGMPLIARSERLSALQLAGLLAAFGGVALAFADGFGERAVGDLQWLGDGLGIVAALLWGATTLVIRGSALSSALPEKTLLYQLVVSGLLLCAGGIAAGEVWPRHPSALTLSLLAFQMLVVTFASYLLWFWLVRHYPATQISSFVLLTPVFGLLAGALLLGEPVTTRLLVALATVTAGIAVVSRPARRRAPP
jgi:rhomboid family GlyGly-CTERM serine protease